MLIVIKRCLISKLKGFEEVYNEDEYNVMFTRFFNKYLLSRYDVSNTGL
jgi:hypothetical protein